MIVPLPAGVTTLEALALAKGRRGPPMEPKALSLWGTRIPSITARPAMAALVGWVDSQIDAGASMGA